METLKETIIIFAASSFALGQLVFVFIGLKAIFENKRATKEFEEKLKRREEQFKAFKNSK